MIVGVKVYSFDQVSLITDGFECVVSILMLESFVGKKRVFTTEVLPKDGDCSVSHGQWRHKSTSVSRTQLGARSTETLELVSGIGQE